MYSGPFDVLLSMIADRRLDLTEVSLSAITEEFLAYVRGLDLTGDMEEASAFLDVAAVLVESKSAALLPGTDDGARDEQSLESLRERDLLFARLLQYRAFKEAARQLRARFDDNAGSFPHPASVDVPAAALLPDLVWTIGVDDLAALAARAFAASPAQAAAEHRLHVPPVDVRGQLAWVCARLEELGEGESLTFAQLVGGEGDDMLVARFLAVLTLFQRGAIQFRQDGPYAPLHLRRAPGADLRAVVADSAADTERDLA
ncbi:segregation and condensation protein A [Bifidobacterium samirii]|uniref:segregation and condensation protein A n=1 Tax=Bifidobacterium samirii TaxID=2306974 RepID=UPI003B971409